MRGGPRARAQAKAAILDQTATSADKESMKTPNAKALRKAKKTEELRGGRPPPPKAHEQAARAMTPHELERIKTQQAYEIFSLLDVDGSGRVSDREMERFIAGDTRHTFKASANRAS